jgi:hypothetical protein
MPAPPGTSTRSIGSSREGAPRVTAADALLAVGVGMARWAAGNKGRLPAGGDGSKGWGGVSDGGSSGIAYDHRDTLAPPAAVA